MIKAVGIEIFIVLTLGVLLGLIGPFGTFETSAGVRMAFWLGTLLMGYAIFRPFLIVSQWVGETLHVPQLIAGGLALMIAALPLTFLIALFFAGFDAARALNSKSLIGLYLQVWLIGFLVNAVFALTLGRSAKQTELASDLPDPANAPDASNPPDPANAVGPSLSTRLLPDLGPIHALKGEDHYVRIFGAAGEQLVLMRLRDAIADLQDDQGLQIHRSWWVSRAAVASVRRIGRTAELTLVDGTLVPVARDMMPRLRALQWL
jgi:hypothetical protein